MAQSTVEAERLRRHQINEQLQQRFMEPQIRNLTFGSILVAVVAALLWPNADHIGLLVWVTLVIATLLPIALLPRLTPSFSTFYLAIFVLEVLSGLAWGSGAILAMPETVVWQSIMLMLFMGVLMSGASNMSHFFGLFLAFHVPLAAAVCVGFVMADTWPPGPFIAIWTLGLGYVGMSAYEARDTQFNLVSGNMDLGAANRALDEQARTDKLTALANRFDFAESLDLQLSELKQSKADDKASRPVTLAYLDIDRFKHINDEFGHHAGDELLRQVASRLSNAAVETEVVARLGGDEMTVLSSVDAHSLGVRVLACFDEPFNIDGRMLEVSASVGVASATRGMSGEELMRNADVALYAAKDAGGSQHEAFGRSLEMQKERRLILESELHDALINGEIVPWVQPIIDLHTGEILGGEALAHWQHRDGVRSASTFMETVRQVGLMPELNEQLLHIVDNFQASLYNSGTRVVPIGLNVGCSDLQQVVDHKIDTPFAVEITEEAVAGEMSETRERLDALKARGCQVWVDSFGTGYSSMTFLTQLPIDGLKIDRSFVAELLTSDRVRGVAAAAVALANQLPADVIAEGVEDPAQAARLRDLGINKAQGHLWSPPVPMAVFAEWLAAGRRFEMGETSSSALPASA